MDILTLKEVLKSCWTPETSSDPQQWSSKNPAWGQCATTALVIQDNFGGDIVWSEAILPDGRCVSHYFNILPGDANGEVDLTREQFPEGTVVAPGVPKTKGYPTTRDYVLSFESTELRYCRLSNALMHNLERLPLRHR